MRARIAVGVLLAVIVGSGAAACYYVDQQTHLRVAKEIQGGVWMAVNADGLRELNALYAKPRLCGERTFRRQTDPSTYLQLCMKAAVPINSDMIKREWSYFPLERRLARSRRDTCFQTVSSPRGLIHPAVLVNR